MLEIVGYSGLNRKFINDSLLSQIKKNILINIIYNQIIQIEKTMSQIMMHYFDGGFLNPNRNTVNSSRQNVSYMSSRQ